jgi:hypothetical protein
LASLALGLAISSVAYADIVLVDFEGYQAGTVVAGEEPGGGTAPGTLFPGVTLSVVNQGGGPHTLIIFDSANPASHDSDLGTPNADFGGPGIGTGGQLGMPGQNDVSLGNILIVAENVGDTAPADGIVDDPDDEAGGGIITAVFDQLVFMEKLTLLDLDDPHETRVKLYAGATPVYDQVIPNLGNNSYQVVEFGMLEVTRMEIILGGSGAIDNLQYRTCYPSATESSRWGSIKGLFR